MNKFVVYSIRLSFAVFRGSCVGIPKQGLSTDLRTYVNHCRRAGPFNSLLCFCVALVTGDCLTETPFDIVSIIISILRASDEKEHVARICNFVHTAVLKRLGNSLTPDLEVALSAMCFREKASKTIGLHNRGLCSPAKFEVQLHSVPYHHRCCRQEGGAIMQCVQLVCRLS